MWYFTVSSVLAVTCLLLTLQASLCSAADDAQPHGHCTADDTDCSAPAQPPAQPHIVLVLCDNMGLDDIGYNSDFFISPTMDELMRTGVNLDYFYAQNLCTPSRAQLLTGKHEAKLGLQSDIIKPDRPYGLLLDESVLPERLAALGYSTHLVGKWHLGHHTRQHTPLARGFHSFYGYYHATTHPFNHTSICPSDPSDVGYDLWDGWEPVPPHRVHGVYDSVLFSNRVDRIISRHDPTKPLFLFYSLHEIHTVPPIAPEKYMKLYDNKTTDEYMKMVGAKVTITDDAVADLVHSLKDNNLWKDTILIFASDNGRPKFKLPKGIGMFGGMTVDLPCVLDETNLRVPAFVHSPLLAPQRRGSVVSDLTHIGDLFPTLLTIAGEEDPERGIDGKNIWHAIKDGDPIVRADLVHILDHGEPPVGESLFTEEFDTRITAAIRMGDFKLITGCRHQVPKSEFQGRMVRPCEKHVIETGRNYWLFNVRNDPWEATDLAADPIHLPLILKMLRRLQEENRHSIIPPFYDDPTLQGTDAACPKHHGGFFKPWM